MHGNPERTRLLAQSATFIALLAAGAWAALPFGPVPVTLQTFFLLLAAPVMKRRAVIPAALYLLLGALNLPVFHAGLSGIGVLLGPSGGFLAGFIPAAAVAGLAYEKRSRLLRIGRAGRGDCHHLCLRGCVAPLLGGDLPPCRPAHRGAPVPARGYPQGGRGLSPGGAAHVIEIKALSHRVLEIPDLLIPAGRMAVIGPNGGGKTTLLRLLAGIDLPEKGEILIDGLPPRSREVGWVGEHPEQNIIFRQGLRRDCIPAQVPARPLFPRG